MPFPPAPCVPVAVGERELGTVCVGSEDVCDDAEVVVEPPGKESINHRDVNETKPERELESALEGFGIPVTLGDTLVVPAPPFCDSAAEDDDGGVPITVVGKDRLGSCPGSVRGSRCVPNASQALVISVK